MHVDADLTVEPEDNVFAYITRFSEKLPPPNLLAARRSPNSTSPAHRPKLVHRELDVDAHLQRLSERLPNKTNSKTMGDVPVIIITDAPVESLNRDRIASASPTTWGNKKSHSQKSQLPALPPPSACVANKLLARKFADVPSIHPSTTRSMSKPDAPSDATADDVGKSVRPIYSAKTRRRRIQSAPSSLQFVSADEPTLTTKLSATAHTNRNPPPSRKQINQKKSRIVDCDPPLSEILFIEGRKPKN